jgi:hypothetical protein
VYKNRHSSRPTDWTPYIEKINKSMKPTDKSSNSKEPTYEDLKEIYTDEDMAESFVFRSTMSVEEREEAEEKLLKLRMESLKASISKSKKTQ